MPTPRKDISTHRLQGTKPAYVEPASDVQAGRPKYPRGISGEAKAAFKRLVRLLEQRRTVTQGDAEILRLYAVNFDRHVRALEHLAVEGEICVSVVLDSNGVAHDKLKPNLWLDVATNAEKFMRGCLADLGLNPLQRAKVKPTKSDEKPTAADIPTREETLLPGEDFDLSKINTEVQ
jgi:P27 family predicted phage terminase small subunit